MIFSVCRCFEDALDVVVAKGSFTFADKIIRR